MLTHNIHVGIKKKQKELTKLMISNWKMSDQKSMSDETIIIQILRCFNHLLKQ